MPEQYETRVVYSWLFLVIFSFWLTYITHIFFNLFENKMKLKDTCSKYEN